MIIIIIIKYMYPSENMEAQHSRTDYRTKKSKKTNIYINKKFTKYFFLTN